MSNQQKYLYGFGDFQLNAEERLLLRNGVPLTLAPKTFDLLITFVEKPGTLLDKNELLQKVWPDTFVEETNLTANISLLRKTLGENGDGQRFIETVPKRGYRFVAPVRRLPALMDEPVIPNVLPTPEPFLSPAAQTKPSFFRQRKTIFTLVSSIGLLLVLVPLIFYWSRNSSRSVTPQNKLWRATFENGLQSEPTWSPDDNFLAFSSDQAGNFDIWTRPAGEGDAVQITKSPAHDWQPDWSPNDGTIVFRSERDGGGLYVIPALGGTERRIADFGYHPRWSPDGSQILFVDTINAEISERRRIFLVGLDGNAPREILADAIREFSYFSGLTWHPDGRRVSLWARQAQTGESLWTLSLFGGAPVRSTLTPTVKAQFTKAGVGIAFNPTGLQWSPAGDKLYFEGLSQGVRNLWQVQVNPDTLAWIDGLRRLTISPGVDRDLRLSRDGKKLAFTTRTETRRIWSLPLKANEGIANGAAQPLTPVGSDTFLFDLSPDGKKIAYYTEQGGRSALRAKSLTDNTDQLFTTVPGIIRAWPRWSHDGKQIAYRHSRRANNRWEYAAGILAVENSASQIITAFADSALFLMTDWTADDKSLLGSMRRAPNNHSAIALFPLNATPPIETQAKILAENPDFNLWSPRFSPDEKWIVFNAIKTAGGNPSTLFVMPASGGDWVQITDGTVWSDKARWSSDGKIIYYVCNRAGFFNVWGINFDSQAGKPLGEPFRVTTLDSPSRMLTPQIVGMQIGVNTDRLIVPLMETAGNIWVLEQLAP